VAKRDHQYDREDPHGADQQIDSSGANEKPPVEWNVKSTPSKKFDSGLEIPMAVTALSYGFVNCSSIDVTAAG
jgi:hypothetical protein